MQRHLIPPGEWREPVHAIAGGDLEQGGIIDYARLVYRKRWLFVSVLAGALALTVVVTLLQTPIHRATASLDVQLGNEDFLNLRAVDPTARITAESAETYLNTQEEIIERDYLLERVVSKLHLESHPLFMPKPSLATRIRALFTNNVYRPQPSAEYAVDVLRRGLSVSARKQTRIIRVSYDSSDPELAALVVNELVDAYLEEAGKARWEKAQSTADSLEPQVTALRAALERSESAIQDYARRADLVMSAGRASAADDKLRQIQTELLSAQADRITKQASYEMASQMPKESLAAVVDSPLAREYQSKLTELRRQYADLTSLLKPESYKVSRLQAQISELETALKNEIGTATQRMRTNFESARSREAMLSAAYQRQVASLSSDELKSIRYNMLKREVDTNRQMYEAMLQRYKEARVASAVRPANVEVIDRAKKPKEPYTPNVPMNLAIGTAAGLFLAFGVVFCASTSGRLTDPGDAEILLKVPELGAIPMADMRRVSAASPMKLLAGPSQPTEKEVELVSWTDRVSPMSESFRETTASLLSQVRIDVPVIVITSPVSGEGKTTVASNLAIVLAETGRRVVLVDGDLRRPRLQKVFGVPNNWGLSNLLRDDIVAPDCSPDGLTRKTQIPGLHVIPSGPGTDSATRLLYSPKMTQLIQRLRKGFDHIVIDVPPVLECADARIFGRHADGVILVFRAGRTNRAMASAAMHRLVMDKVPVIGSVLNDCRDSRKGLYAYYATAHA